MNTDKIDHDRLSELLREMTLQRRGLEALPLKSDREWQAIGFLQKSESEVTRLIQILADLKGPRGGN